MTDAEPQRARKKCQHEFDRDGCCELCGNDGWSALVTKANESRAETDRVRGLAQLALRCANERALGWERVLRLILRDAIYDEDPRNEADNATDKPSQPSA
jgi:hypothetical protein